MVVQEDADEEGASTAIEESEVDFDKGGGAERGVFFRNEQFSFLLLVQEETSFRLVLRTLAFRFRDISMVCTFCFNPEIVVE